MFQGSEKPISFMIRLLKRYPDKGLQSLSQAVMAELRRIKISVWRACQFHTVLLDLLFPPPQIEKFLVENNYSTDLLFLCIPLFIHYFDPYNGLDEFI